MTARSRTRFAVAGLAAAIALGAGLGATAFAVLDGGATTIVRQVTVEGSEPVASDSLTVAQVYDRTSKAVVEISASSGASFGGTQSAQGSGFVFDEQGHIVTNQHVVAGASSISVSFWNGAEFDAEVVGTDPSTDLAVLRVDAPKSLLVPLRLANSNDVEVGDSVLALGSPFGLEGTVTSGIVSALHREMTAPNNFTITDTIQTDAAINHGNSGGPLLDRRGRAIGVNAQIESESGGSDGVGFAIPSNTVGSIVRQLIATGEVEHAYLGILMTAVPDGVAIKTVLPGTPAAAAGLRAATGSEVVDGQQLPTGGDVIVSFDGEEVMSAAALQSAVDAHRPGDAVTLTILRGNSRRTLDVKLGVRP
ncbi:MAG TPA: trypsin-like peptidase domain-containing protein [Gaiellaceae bacterium]|nr:trypsin-like peptidase domain-containing protein [Gaiellaceae bacterium]